MIATESRALQEEETRREIEDLIAAAEQVVPPLWPLETAIAVNPLAGFEPLPFDAAVREAAALFEAHTALPMLQWRALLDRGDVSERALKQAAIRRLGGLDRGFALVTPDRSRVDLLMNRLLGEAQVEPVYQPAASFSPARKAGPEMLGYAKAFVAKWCGAFFDQSVATMPMPHRRAGLYKAVLRFASYDPDFWRFGGSDSAGLTASADTDAETAVANALTALGVEGANRLAFLKELVARLPGWAGHIRWRERHADPMLRAQAPAGMADLLAVWLLLERACALRPDQPAEAAAPTADPARQLALQAGLTAAQYESLPLADAAAIAEIAALDDLALGLIWLEAAEASFQDDLMPLIETRAQSIAQARSGRPDAQLVFCIDVRSEPLRRAIESTGDYETFGYAGFFGLPITAELPHEHARHQLPVLLNPAHRVPLSLVESRTGGAARAFGEMVAQLKTGAATGFAAAEAIGPYAAVISAARTLAPRLWPQRANPGWSAAFKDAAGHVAGINLDARVAAARGLFAATGMARRTARLVVLAGHGGAAQNNPYAAALDCGACGGRAGGLNARILAAILNDPEVRAALATDGEAIPGDSWFIGAEHNTTTDALTLLDLEAAPATHADDLRILKDRLATAGTANRERRALDLCRDPFDAFVAASHWGEVRPEWGLARNAAFVVGPRSLTRGIDLKGRAFLHSYDWRTDADASVLSLILTAPMVVAQWINCQYLFSTLDHPRYGSGDKTTHNVMGGIGVVQGNGGDLRIGLPQQSLFRDDGSPHHVPQRLLTIVHAPLARVEQVIAQHEQLQRLFGNGWVRLVVIDPQTGEVRRWREDREIGADAPPATAPGETAPARRAPRRIAEPAA